MQTNTRLRQSLSSPAHARAPGRSIKRVAVLALAACATVASFGSLAAGGNLGALGLANPSASFGDTVSGAFTDHWLFTLADPSLTAGSLTNTSINFGSEVIGRIVGWTASFDGTVLTPLNSDNIPGGGGFTYNIDLLIGGATLPTGPYDLTISGTGISGGSTASYSGNITTQIGRASCRERVSSPV